MLWNDRPDRRVTLPRMQGHDVTLPTQADELPDTDTDSLKAVG